MPKELEFTFGQPVQAVHADGSVLKGKYEGEKIRIAGMDAWLIEGLERIGYVVKTAAGTVITSTAQLQKLPNGSVVMGNLTTAIKEDGKWVISGYIQPRLSSELWDYLIDITAIHVPGGAE